MSRLPGGVFVGVVTLLCGLGFAQLELGSRERIVPVEPRSTKSAAEKRSQPTKQKLPAESEQKVAADQRPKS